MIKRVEEFLRKYNLSKKTIIVGFSGGNDSMCLLDILSKIKSELEFMEMNIVAAHFNHNWRGEESLAEQEVCRMFAFAKGIEFFTKTASNDVKKTENDARIARYEFFEDVMDVYDTDIVLTAHNKDDNAETVLYRVIKGTGLVGLKGIAENRGCYYRPLLKTTRAEIEQYCNEFGLSPNQDSSNSNVDYKRNFLRLEVLPELRKINQNVNDALNNLSEVAISEDLIIDEYLTPIREKVFLDDTIISENYKPLSEPVKKRLLHEYIQNLGIDYDLKKIKEIYDFIEANINQKNGTTLSIASARWLYVDNKIIEPIPKKSEKIKQDVNLLITDCGDYNVEDRVLSIESCEDEFSFVYPGSTDNKVYADLSNVSFPLHIRTRQDGDIISPFGMQGTMKLKKYLNSKGISKHNRDNVLLLADDKEVLWAIGVGISNKISVKTLPTHVIEIR